RTIQLGRHSYGRTASTAALDAKELQSQITSMPRTLHCSCIQNFWIMYSSMFTYQKMWPQPTGLQANNSFKPNLLRYTKHMAEKACHVFGSTTQVGLTQALGLAGGSSMNWKIIASFGVLLL